jgi:hypothetical protein
VFGKGFSLQGDLDAQRIKLMVDNIQRRLTFVDENGNDTEDSVKHAIVESLQKQCNKVNFYIKAMFFGIDEEDGDDATDGAAAAAPVVLAPWFEKPSPDKAIYMGCSMDPECRRQGKANLRAFCVYCNECGQMGKLSESLSLFQWCVRYATNTTAGLIAYMRGLPQSIFRWRKMMLQVNLQFFQALSKVLQLKPMKYLQSRSGKGQRMRQKGKNFQTARKNNNKTDSE